MSNINVRFVLCLHTVKTGRIFVPGRFCFVCKNKINWATTDLTFLPLYSNLQKFLIYLGLDPSRGASGTCFDLEASLTRALFSTSLHGDIFYDIQLRNYKTPENPEALTAVPPESAVTDPG